MVPAFVGKIRKEANIDDLLLTEDTGEKLLAMLENNQLDAVITGGKYAEADRWKEKFIHASLGPTDLSYCVGAGSKLAKFDELSLKQIAEEPAVMLSRDFPLTKSLEDLFKERGLELNVVLRSSQLFTIENFIASGIAGGFLPRDAALKNRDIKLLSCPEIDNFRDHPAMLFYKGSNTYAGILNAMAH